MDPITIFAAASAVGSAFNIFSQNSTNNANRNIGRENNVFSAQQAQLNRNFQERMSNTEWQRGTADMRAAGVNPMLAVSQGGASSPSGNSAQGIATANQQAARLDLASSARDAILLKSQKENIEAQTYAAKAQGLAADTQAGLNLTRSQLEGLKIPEARLGAKVADSKWGMAAHLAERYGVNMNTALSLVGKFQRPSSTTSFYNSKTGEVSRTVKKRY